MKWYWIKTSRWIKKLFPHFTWDMGTDGRTVYLTFDDGPTKGITEQVLAILEQHDVKATFFLIGKNIAAHPEIVKRIAEAGHSVGNHTYNHLNGWHTSTDRYMQNVFACQRELDKLLPSAKSKPAKLFRPPYGKIKPSQARALRLEGYKIIMWDVLTADFDQSISKEECLENATKRTVSGSIVIFHDSVKAGPNMLHALPRTIAYLKEKGYRFKAIS